MATMHIDILNPVIDLITNHNTSSNSCKSIHTFDILTTPNASLTVTTTRVSPNVEDWDKLYINNGNGWQETTPVMNFTMNSTGKASFKVEIGNVETVSIKTPRTCNTSSILVTDNTNNKTEELTVNRCITGERCTTAPTNPTPTEPKIDSGTNIRIYFDSSGSMEDTLPALERMRDVQLKNVLQSHYGSSYDSKVKIYQDKEERIIKMLNYDNLNLSGKVISLVFANESSPVYVDDYWGVDNPSRARTSIYETDIKAFRTRLSGFPTNYYKGVVFQVNTYQAPSSDPEEGRPYDKFIELLHAIEDGTGNYAGEYGLADKDEVIFKYNITSGEDLKTGTTYTETELNNAAIYYKDQVVAALNELGFNITG